MKLLRNIIFLYGEYKLNRNIFVSCGEVSGDLYAGLFINEFLKIRPEFEKNIFGMCGPRGELAGCESLWSYENLKLMGIFEVLPALPRVLKLRNEITNEILKRNPEAVILIDSPDFHLQLARHLRNSGYAKKIISLIPPTVWAWRSGRIENLKRDFDFCLPLFSFEHEFLKAHSVNSYWKAHPLVNDFKNFKTPEKFYRRFSDKNVIALMPGSRKNEIKFHIEILLKTAEILRAKNYLPVFSVSCGLSKNIADYLREKITSSGFEIWEGEGRDLMSGACAAAGVSGTVAVEAMLLKKFMVVIYNMQKLTYFILKNLVHVKKISIPNYLTSEEVFPELIYKSVTPENIIKKLDVYLDNKEYKTRIDSLLDNAKNLMGTDNAAKFWAECVSEKI